MVGQLGPFQDIWDAWAEAKDAIAAKPISHFRRAVELQFDELEQHLRAGERERAAREIADIISIALNLLRKLDYQPDEIAAIARSRAEQRMKGQAMEILEKYHRLHGI